MARSNLDQRRRDVSLISFHKILIAIAILFCGGYGGYELVAFAKTGGTGALALGGVFLLLAAGLGYYLWRLNHFLGFED